MLKKALTPMLRIFLLLLFCIGAVTLFAAVTSQEIYGSGNSVVLSVASSGVFEWFEKYWPYVALVTSELLAFLPKPYNGILQVILKIGNSIFKK